MTRTIRQLIKAKTTIEKRIELNSNLIETAEKIQQDSKNMQEENEALNMTLKLLEKEIRRNYNT